MIRSHLVRFGLAILLLYASWLAMMGVHEFGHVLHAWVSGGSVKAVHFGPFEFSRTELIANPHPQFVAWGGPVWGSLIPLAAYGLATALRWRRPLWFLCFFAGFALSSTACTSASAGSTPPVTQAPCCATAPRHGSWRRPA